MAITATQTSGSLRSVQVALGGVAPVPNRTRGAEEYLEGRPASQVDPPHTGSLALPHAQPMTDNGYKVILAKNLVKNAVTQLLGTFS